MKTHKIVIGVTRVPALWDPTCQYTGRCVHCDVAFNATTPTLPLAASVQEEDIMKQFAKHVKDNP